MSTRLGPLIVGVVMLVQWGGSGPNGMGGSPQQRILPGMASPQERLQNGGNPWPRGTVGNPTYSLPQPRPGFNGGQVVPNQPLRPMGWGQ